MAPLADPDWPEATSLLGPTSTTVALLSIPLEASISPSQAQRGPKAIRRALGRYSTLDAFTGAELPEDCCRDSGELTIAGATVEDKLTSVEREVTRLHIEQPAQLWLFLGGDNAITQPCLTALAGDDLSRAALLAFDAHHDVRSFYNGPSNGTPVRGLIEAGLPGSNVSQIGLGRFTNSATYRDWARERGVHLTTVEQVNREGMVAVVERELARLGASADWIYINVDFDVLDRAFAPACPGARPGGLSPAQLFEGLYWATRFDKVVACDFVEIDPSCDGQQITALTAAQAILVALSGFYARQ